MSQLVMWVFKAIIIQWKGQTEVRIQGHKPKRQYYICGKDKSCSDYILSLTEEDRWPLKRIIAKYH